MASLPPPEIPALTPDDAPAVPEAAEPVAAAPSADAIADSPAADPDGTRTGRRGRSRRRNHHRATDHRHSAGGVVVRGAEVLLIASKSGHRWRLPKGRLEQGETSQQAALRETREETGVTGCLREPLPGIEYWYTEGGQRRIHKRVDFYLLDYVSGEPVEFDRHEVAEAAWFSWDEGLRRLWFENERSVLRRARELCPDPDAEEPSP